ncbi:MAG TPA: protein tyrosine phosphatase [Clostridium sp.]|nr:protein tyrosine phosphatase [Clostridia bacterium]HCW04524.1 protein tyrosine phosphatase [Clostridium sp.]
MIDFHCHILPGVDDGSVNIEMTKEMIDNSLNQGVEYLCATPHFITEESEITLEAYKEKLQFVKDNIENIEIIPGLEIYIDPELPKLYKENRIWGYNYNKYLLIELPMMEFPIYTEKIFYDLRLMGAIPVLAHPERNLRIMKNPELLINLIEQGNLAQLNAGSLTGQYGTDIKKSAEKLVSRNLIHIVGSDGHNNKRRNTNIKDGLEKIEAINPELFNWIKNNQKKILQGEDVEVLDIIDDTKKKSFFSFFLKK